MDVIDVIAPDLSTDPEWIDTVILDLEAVLDTVTLVTPTIDIVFEGEPGRQGPPGPNIDQYVYFDETTQTWPARPDLPTVVWVGGSLSNFPTDSLTDKDLWVRDTV